MSIKKLIRKEENSNMIKREKKSGFYNRKRSDNRVTNLPDGDYSGVIITVKRSTRKEMSIIDIKVNDNKETFVTFIYDDLDKSYRWRDFITDENIEAPEDLKGIEITFTIINNKVNGKTYSNLEEIAIAGVDSDHDESDDESDQYEDDLEDDDMED